MIVDAGGLVEGPCSNGGGAGKERATRAVGGWLYVDAGCVCFLFCVECICKGRDPGRRAI